ncbi:hypothetical protein N431DRAFT_553378 [Stipitochalara longipes BDJ]|nr:hypothetical protein N431DRAFT_553378 [Stipitochalara longipes BDJ]
MAVSETLKKRKCGPKTKSGCQTCKIRRIKCDETRPICLRCSKTGRKCDGYALEAVAIPLDNRRSLALVQRLHTHTPGNSQEKRAFQYFITRTAVELSGFYSSSFWEQLILQASTAEPSLRHAVTGIGALHEEYVNGTLKYDVDKSNPTFAVSQYTKALGHLRKSLANGKQPPLTALMSCILFVCFDSLRGHFTSAMVHLHSGLKILRDLRTDSAAESDIIEESLGPLFNRLSLQSILYVDTRTTVIRRDFVAQLRFVRSKDDEVPEAFQTLEEARTCLNQAADGLFRVFYLCDGDLPISQQPAESYAMFDTYYTKLQAWNPAFERFMAAKSQILNGRQLRGAAVLKIHATIVKIMAEASPGLLDDRPIGEAMNDHATFEPFTNDFRIVVTLCKSIIAAAEQDIKLGRPALNFSTDLGIVGPLYYVCCRCRDLQLRTQALELLTRCPRREGMWDSEVGVRMIKEYWAIEERHQAFQKDSAAELGINIPLCEVVDLVFTDGMRWEWVWKNPLDPPTRESSIDTVSTTSVSTPGGGWADMVRSGRAYSSIKKETASFSSSPHTFYFFKHERNSPQPP